MQANKTLIVSEPQITSVSAYSTSYPLPSILHKEHIYEALKRIFDIIGAILALTILSPLLAGVALMIKAEDGGPAIFVRMCIGKDGRNYKMYKFRSMSVNADDLERWFTPEQIEEYNREIKLKQDPRITKVGTIIRKFSVDELPQLFCILQGTMSFVGPRPMVQQELSFFQNKIDDMLDVKPGLTGYWQTHGRSDCTYESGKRQELELFYVANRSLWMDFMIMLKTAGVVLSRKGAY